MRSDSQSGNVFYVILIGIVLFAALSAVIVQSGKGDTSALSNEKAEIYAAEIIQYSSAMAGAVRRMMMVNECSETQLSFYKSGLTHAGFQHSPDLPNKCQVFHPEGGGMTYQTPRTEWFSVLTWQEWLISGAICMTEIGTFSAASCADSETELTVTIYGLKKEVCDQINKKLGVPVSSPPVEAFSSGRFNGSYGYSNFLVGTTAAIKGRKGYCLSNSTYSNYYTFVYALLPR